MYVKARSLSSLWFDVLQFVMRGDVISPRGLRTREVRGAVLELEYPVRNILTVPGRRLNHYFALAEWLWMLCGRNDVASIAQYNSRIAQFSDDGKTLAGAYGPRIIWQLPYIIETLTKDPYSRQAVMTIWHPNPAATKDVPCTVMFQFQLRPSGLELDVFMRSNDIWLGMPYDIFNFTMTQQYVAAALGAHVSTYRHHVGSLHIYEKHWSEAAEIISGFPPPTFLCAEAPTYPMPPIMEAVLIDPCAFEHVELPAPWNGYADVLRARFTDDVDTLPQDWWAAVTKFGIRPRTDSVWYIGSV